MVGDAARRHGTSRRPLREGRGPGGAFEAGGQHLRRWEAEISGRDQSSKPFLSVPSSWKGGGGRSAPPPPLATPAGQGRRRSRQLLGKTPRARGAGEKFGQPRRCRGPRISLRGSTQPDTRGVNDPGQPQQSLGAGNGAGRREEQTKTWPRGPARGSGRTQEEPASQKRSGSGEGRPRAFVLPDLRSVR